MNYIIPIFILITLIIAVIKKVNVFNSFAEGMKEAIKLTVNILPYLASVFILVELMRASGLSLMIGKAVAPALTFLGIPKELAELLILRPLSGSGSLVFLESLYSTYGVDSYPARVASVIMGATDTILYISAVYLSTSKEKRSGLAIPISLIASFVGVILASWLCLIM
ncbi:MAG: spore maturation protein [Firmicutes bacterium]|nr:spore maturation protein [Bacillota bacterium]